MIAAAAKQALIDHTATDRNGRNAVVQVRGKQSFSLRALNDGFRKARHTTMRRLPPVYEEYLLRVSDWSPLPSCAL